MTYPQNPQHVLIDRYEVRRLLGTGGMAEVFEGYDRLLARRVAVKVLLSQYARDPAFLTRFRREAQAAASLSHPNIVAVYDTGAQGDTQFIVMEYVEGRTLRDVVRQEGPLLPERAAEIAADVCNALAAAHARGLIHRDIKPGNIMLTPDGKVKVMDFGIARATSMATITQTAAVVGTAQYISPEQAQGQPVDARSDLYSLGCCLYEMLSGHVPFTGATPVAIAYRHVRENPMPPRQLNPDVPPALEAVVMKAMAKDPDERYQTAPEFRADLERARLGEPVMAGPLPGAAATTQVVPGRQYPAGDQGTMALPPSTPMPPSRVARYGDTYEQGRPARSSGWLWFLATLLALLLAGLVAFFLIRNSGNTGSPSTTSLPVVAPGSSTTTEAPTTSQAPTTSRATTTTQRATTTTRRTTTTSSSTTTTASTTTAAAPVTTVAATTTVLP